MESRQDPWNPSLLFPGLGPTTPSLYLLPRQICRAIETTVAWLPVADALPVKPVKRLETWVQGPSWTLQHDEAQMPPSTCRIQARSRTFPAHAIMPRKDACRPWSPEPSLIHVGSRSPRHAAWRALPVWQRGSELAGNQCNRSGLGIISASHLPWPTPCHHGAMSFRPAEPLSLPLR